MKTKQLFTAFVLIVGLLLSSCGPAAAPALAVPQGTHAGELTGMKPCEYQPSGEKAKYAAECGTLTVPENWNKPGSRLIALPVVRIPASGSSPAEPVFWLVGGPGGPNITWAPPGWLLEEHDVVMVGYRGVEGTVKLSCPGVARLMKAHVGRDLFSEQARTEEHAAVQQCAADLQAQGIDISGYTMPGVIADMEAVRTALGYDRIDLFSESYGTRVAQLYAYLHPDSLSRVVMIGVNTPGHFLYYPSVIDDQIRYLAKLCAQDAACSSRTPDLAQTIYNVDHDMPRRWLFFNIDPDTVRLAMQFLLFDNANIATVADVYLAAAHGDASGLAMANIIMTLLIPADQWTLGEYFSKGGSADRGRYTGLDSISLGGSIMGAPLSELMWPMALDWPVEMLPQDLRKLQQSNVQMLLVNGTVDFSTPPVALDEAKPYYHNAQMVLLPEFSHVGDVYSLQQPAFERLITSYYDTGVADSSLYVYQPLSFKPKMDMPLLGKVLAAAIIILPLLLLWGILRLVRIIRRRRSAIRY